MAVCADRIASGTVRWAADRLPRMPSEDDEPDFEPYLAPRRGGRAGARASAAEAFAAIRDGARIAVSPACGTPLQLLEALAEERGRWRELTIVAGLFAAPIGPAAFVGEPFRFVTMHPSRFTPAKSNGGF